MLKKILTKIDRFYFILGGVLVVLAVLITFTASKIFTAYAESQRVDEKLLNSVIPRINRGDLDKAYKVVTEKNIIPLDLRP